MLDLAEFGDPHPALSCPATMPRWCPVGDGLPPSGVPGAPPFAPSLALRLTRSSPRCACLCNPIPQTSQRARTTATAFPPDLSLPCHMGTPPLEMASFGELQLFSRMFHAFKAGAERPSYTSLFLFEEWMELYAAGEEGSLFLGVTHTCEIPVF